MTFLLVTSDLLGPPECTKFVLHPDSGPDPTGKALDAPRDLLVSCGGGYLLPIFLPFNAFVVWIASVLGTFGASQLKFRFRVPVLFDVCAVPCLCPSVRQSVCHECTK